MLSRSFVADLCHLFISDTLKKISFGYHLLFHYIFLNDYSNNTSALLLHRSVEHTAIHSLNEFLFLPPLSMLGSLEIVKRIMYVFSL